MNAKESFVHFLVEAGALKFGNFVTKSGRETPYFINTGEFRTGATLSKLAEYPSSGVVCFCTPSTKVLRPVMAPRKAFMASSLGLS